MCKVLVWYDKELANEMLDEVWDVLDRLYGHYTIGFSSKGISAQPNLEDPL